MSEADNLFGQDHVDRYRETDGQVGHEWRGAHTLLLTTKGRKSGEAKTTPLIYAPYGDNAYTVVASKGGADAPPSWFVNIQDDPEVEVQILGDKFHANGRVATPEEKPEMWQTMIGEWPDYDEYQQNTDREIPVVVLERI
jgi:deazaflavin-dependent oxidoreductase (nitroreductase family)